MTNPLHDFLQLADSESAAAASKIHLLSEGPQSFRSSEGRRRSSDISPFIPKASSLLEVWFYDSSTTKPSIMQVALVLAPPTSAGGSNAIRSEEARYMRGQI